MILRPCYRVCQHDTPMLLTLLTDVGTVGAKVVHYSMGILWRHARVRDRSRWKLRFYCCRILAILTYQTAYEHLCIQPALEYTSSIDIRHGHVIDIHVKQWDVFNHPYPNLNGGVVKPPIKVRNVCVITRRSKSCPIVNWIMFLKDTQMKIF